MSVIVLGMMALYLVVASIAVLLVWKRTSRKLYRWMAVAIAVLLPTWDVVLSTVFFYAACPFISKAEIYETAETDGIYYEGDYRNKVLIVKDWNGEKVKQILYDDNDIKNGYKYVESLVTEIQDSVPGREKAISPGLVYRCMPLPENPRRAAKVFTYCSPADGIQSGYRVETKRFQFGLNEINSIKIYNRTTGKIMAVYRDISKSPYTGARFYPFFTWLNWDRGEFRSGTTEFVSCPAKEHFWNFQYEVLKAKK